MFLEKDPHQYTSRAEAEELRLKIADTLAEHTLLESPSKYSLKILQVLQPEKVYHLQSKSLIK